MTHLQFGVLQDIRYILNIPHRAQELLSAEQTPTLSLAFPVYENLISNWREAAKRLPAFAYAIEAGISKLEDYVATARSSEIHILAMFLNPCVKYSWIDKNWAVKEKTEAREVVKRYVSPFLLFLSFWIVTTHIKIYR